MTAATPFLKNEERLGALDSRYVAVDSLPWKPTPCPGIDMKILLEDKESGLLTALFRWQAGAELALHEHAIHAENDLATLSSEPGFFRPGSYAWILPSSKARQLVSFGS